MAMLSGISLGLEFDAQKTEALSAGVPQGTSRALQGAIADFDRVIADDGQGLAFVSQAQSRYAMSDFHGAIFDLDAALNLDASNVDAFT